MLPVFLVRVNLGYERIYLKAMLFCFLIVPWVVMCWVIHQFHLWETLSPRTGAALGALPTDRLGQALLLKLFGIGHHQWGGLWSEQSHDSRRAHSRHLALGYVLTVCLESLPFYFGIEKNCQTEGLFKPPSSGLQHKILMTDVTCASCGNNAWNTVTNRDTRWDLVGGGGGNFWEPSDP